MTKPIISAQADFGHDRLHFARQRSDRLPLEKMPTQEPWLHVIAGGVSVVAFMVGAFWTLDHVADVLRAMP